MLTLALEQSTPAAGIALLRDDTTIAAYHWHEARKRDQNLFSALPGILHSAGVQLDAVERFAIGLGPGSFSGVRIAIAAASAMALPGAVPLAGVSSAAAVAWQVMRDTAASAVAVLGDARRKRLWMAAYAQAAPADPPRATHPLALLPVEELRERLPAGCCVVSPDWDRLAAILVPLAGEGWTVIKAIRTPSAEDVGRLAVRQSQEELCSPLDPPQPLYLHPAVFVPPRFPAA